MIRIVLDRPDFCIAEKPAFIPVEKDRSQTPDMLSALSLQVGRNLYLIHRLDLPVGGLLVFAKNKNAAGILSSLVAEGKMEKQYFAIVEGIPDAEGTFRDYLKKEKDHAVVCKESDKDAKYAELSYRLLASSTYEGLPVSLVSVSLKTGRFHQIRSQFASRGMPLLGDGKYGSRRSHTPMALYSYSLSFVYHKEKIAAKLLPNVNALPFSVFSMESYQK